MVRMEDDSMAPEVKRDWWAFVDPDEPMAPGRLLGCSAWRTRRPAASRCGG